MCRHAGFRWGGAGQRERTRSSGGRGGSGRGGRLCCVVWSVLCCVFPFSISSLLLFPLFAVLLNCPYPDPPVSACFFPFSSAPRRGEGWPRGAFVAGRSQTRTQGQALHPYACILRVSVNIAVGNGPAQLNIKDLIFPLIILVNYIFSKSVCYHSFYLPATRFIIVNVYLKLHLIQAGA